MAASIIGLPMTMTLYLVLAMTESIYSGEVQVCNFSMPNSEFQPFLTLSFKICLIEQFYRNNGQNNLFQGLK